ncbi:MAG: RNA methyltransferase [Mycoplasmataceae bacterium]|jgi:TrmH family RNA methyltransferase|nr:RNA methyltransferase [Mycoplasmataceae bacterium]
MIFIESKNNKVVKLASSLFSDKKYRVSTGLFICETYRVFLHLQNNGINPEFVIINKASKYFSFFSKKENVYSVDSKLFSSLSKLGNSDGIIMVYKKNERKMELSKEKKYLILDKIQNPNNLGNIARTASCFNVDGLIVTNCSVDIYHPDVIRSSMGSILTFPVMFSTSLKDTVTSLKKAGVKVYVSSLSKKAESIVNVKFPSSGLAIAFGNEGNGISENDLKLFDNNIVYIPINDKTDSLNVGNAVAIFLFAAFVHGNSPS